MKITLFKIPSEEKSEAIKKLVDYSTPRQSFFFFIIFSIVMAAFGLLDNNTAIVIGAMLIAPVLYPVLSLGLGIAMSDFMLVKRSATTLVKSILLAIIASVLVALFFSSPDIPISTDLINRIKPNLIDVAIAVVAGLAASFALVASRFNEAIPGIAISVALVPPLTMIGIGISKLNWIVLQNASLLFLINILGVIFTSVFMFSMMNFYRKKEFTDKTIKKEDKTIKSEA